MSEDVMKNCCDCMYSVLPKHRFPCSDCNEHSEFKEVKMLSKSEADGVKPHEPDNVNHPKHYEGKFECIDAMVECFGVDAVADFCLGNAFKYLWRCMKKHDEPTEDIKKAHWYLSKWIELEK